MQSVGSPALWAGFITFILGMLLVDLVVFHRRPHEESTRGAAWWTVVCIGISLLFALGVYLHWNSTKAAEFVAGYVIEYALSVDNLFVFLVLFRYFAVPPALQHRVLFWGVLGAIVFRAIFIVAGAALVHQFHWVLYIFGAFLLYTAAKLLFSDGEPVDPEQNPVLRFMRRFVECQEPSAGF